MQDDYLTHYAGIEAPARDAAQIVPSDSAALPFVSRALYIGASGSLRVRMISGAEVTFARVEAGQIYPIRIEKVLATGTSATGLLALR